MYRRSHKPSHLYIATPVGGRWHNHVHSVGMEPGRVFTADKTDIARIEPSAKRAARLARGGGGG